MEPTRRFLFDLSFDPVAAPDGEALQVDLAKGAADEPVEPPPPPPPTFSEEELMEARARGYAEGEAAGRGAAEADGESQVALHLASVSKRLAELLRHRDHGDAELRQEAAQFAVSMIRRLHPALARRHGLDETEAVIRECMSGLLKEPRLTVRVPPDVAEPLAGRLSALAEEIGFDGRLDIRPDDGLAPGDCRLAWSEGSAERISAAVWQTVEAAMARLFGEPAEASAAEGPATGPADDETDPDTTADEAVP